MTIERTLSAWLPLLLVCATLTGCGRIGYGLQDLSGGRDGGGHPDVVETSPGADASTGAMDAAVGMDAMAADTEATTADAGAFDVATEPDATMADGDASPMETGTVDAESGAPDVACGSSCCCAYACKYATVPVAATCGGSSDTAQYGFESGLQGWAMANASNVDIPGQVSVTTTPAFAGSSSLEGMMTVPMGSSIYLRARGPVIPLGATVTFHVWLPPGAPILAVQGYVMDANYTFTGSYVEAGQMVLGCWATITIVVPTTAVPPLFEIGVQFAATTTAPYNGVGYVDSVSW